MDATELFRNYRIPIILGGISILSIVVSIVLLVKSTQTSGAPIQFSSDIPGASSSSVILVDVEGAVVNPGVYTLPGEARVEDALVAAGGTANDVDEEVFAKIINRAAKISDGMKIYVPAIGGDQTSHNPNPIGATTGSSQNGIVSVNFATAAQLDVLPGVGPATAQKIIDNRPYQSLEDLVTKKAIGPSLYDKLKNSLSL